MQTDSSIEEIVLGLGALDLRCTPLSSEISPDGAVWTPASYGAVQDVQLYKGLTLFVQIQERLLVSVDRGAGFRHEHVAHLNNGLECAREPFDSTSTIDQFQPYLLEDGESRRFETFADLKAGVQAEPYLYPEQLVIQTNEFMVGQLKIDSRERLSLQLKRTVDLYSFNNRMVRIVCGRCFASGAIFEPFSGSGRTYTCQLCKEEMRDVDPQFAIIGSHVCSLNSKMVYQPYSAYQPGFVSVSQNVLYFEREDEFDREPDYAYYDQFYKRDDFRGMRSVERIKEQVEGLVGYVNDIGGSIDESQV